MSVLFEVKGEIKENYNLSHLTWFKVGGNAEIFFKPYDLQDLSFFLQQNANKFPITIMGAGSNIIIRDGGIEGTVVKLGKNFTNIELIENELKVGSNCLNFNLAKFCLSNFIIGFEFLVGIPGTLGGGVVMNSGAYDREFKDIITAIEVVNSQGKVLNLSATEIDFRYRGTNLPKDYIITSVSFKVSQGDMNSINALMNEINQKRSSTQPIKEKTGGSTFANPEGYKAWELIDKAGLRGYRMGGASISELHCNFMINHGNATAKELEDLGELARAEVFKNSGIMLEWEIKRIGKYAYFSHDFYRKVENQRI